MRVPSINPHARMLHDGADGGDKSPSPPRFATNAPVHFVFALVTAPEEVGGLG